MTLAGQRLLVSRQGPAQNALALQALIAQQQAALVARLTGRPPPPPPSLLAALSGAGAAGAPAAAAAAAAPPADASAPPLPADQSPPAAAPTPSARRVVRLAGMVSRADLIVDDDHADLVQEITDEVAKYGRLLRVVVPRPRSDGGGGGGGDEEGEGEEDPPGVGLVFLEYAEARSAENARLALDRREFGEGRITASLEEPAALEGLR